MEAYLNSKWKFGTGRSYDGSIKNLTAEGVYGSLQSMMGGAREASLFLKRAGIDGIRYPTESLSGKGKTSDAFNYVVFDDKDVRLVQRESGGAVEDLLNRLSEGQ